MLRDKVKFLACAAARKCAVLALIASAWLGSFAEDSNAGFNDGVNRDDGQVSIGAGASAGMGEGISRITVTGEGEL